MHLQMIRLTLTCTPLSYVSFVCTKSQILNKIVLCYVIVRKFQSIIPSLPLLNRKVIGMDDI